jgi:hypothetical protein
MATLMKYSKTEVFNPNAMQALLRHDGIDFQTKQLMQKYYKRRENGNRVSTLYDFCKDYASSGVGRLYVAHGLGLQAFPKDVRNALAEGLYWDIDMVNAHPTILVQLCEQMGWSCEGLKHYVHNREQVINDITTHYGCSHADAKNLMIRLLFLGSPEAWVGASVCELSTEHMPYIEGVKRELDCIATNVYGAYTNVSDVVRRKKKKTQQQKLSSTLSLVLQSEEHKIIMNADLFLSTQGRSMDVLVFDGGLVRRAKDEVEFPEGLLRGCEEFVKEKTGYTIHLVVKPLKTTFEVGYDKDDYVPSHVIVDDVYAAKAFVKLMEGKIVYTDNALYVFDDTTGLWTCEKHDVRRCIHKFDDELKFRQLDEAGKEKVFNYSGKESHMNNMLQNVPTFCVCDDFFYKNMDTSRGKWLFSNGIYDLDTEVFTEGFDPLIVFKDRIDRPFPTHRKEEFVSLVKRILFEDTFMSDEIETSDCLRVAIARALYGDYRAKQFYFCVGKSNAGKGVLADALKSAFGGYVGTFNAKALAYNDNSSADAAKQLSWVFGIKDKRMAISNEVSMSKAFDGNMLKMLASGGDEFDARKNHKDEVKAINRSTLFCFVNDIPTINPLDDGGINRVRCMEFNCVFKDAMEVDGEKEFERAADKEIKDKFANNLDYQDALVWVMIDAYRLFKQNGHNIPDRVKNATKEWTGDVGSVSGLLDMKYEVTRNDQDAVPARDIINFLTKEKQLKMSETKIGRELAGLKLVKKDMKLKGKTMRVWCGLKERADFYGSCMVRDDEPCLMEVDDNDPLEYMASRQS